MRAHHHDGDLDAIDHALSAASTAPPAMRVIYAAEARCRLVRLRERLERQAMALEALEAEIERVAREAGR